MRSGSVQALSKGRGSMGLWKATVFLLVIVVTTSTGQTCDRDIPFDYNGVYVTYSSATSIPIDEWCPDTSKDNAPYIEFRFEPEGQTAVSKIITTTKDKYNTAGYAATYNIFLSYPPNVKLNGTLLGRKNVSAVRVGESGNITTYFIVFNASVPFKTVRIEPISSVDATGGKCMSIYFQGCNTSELCTTACQNGGTCVGQNLCECREGFFGTSCSLTTDDVRQSPIGSRLHLVSHDDRNFVFNKATFISSVSTGVSVNLSRIDLNGFGAYLWTKKADLDKPFDCLTNIDLYSAFTMLFRFRVNSFNRDRPSVILATNAFSKTKGVNIFIQNDNGVNSLNVTFRRLNRQWTAIASTEALQTTGQWVDVNIRWENSFGLELVLNGKDIGRALVSTSSNNEEADYLCLGYPSYGYESYDNNISIRDLTIIPTVSSQIRPSIEAGASTLRIEVANGTVSSQQLGPSLRVFSSSGFSSTGTEIRLKGSNVYLTTNKPTPFFDLLLDPSRYQTFTGSYIFSVDNVNVVNYIIDTGNYTGVTMYLSANLELVVELKWVFMQHRVTYRFSQIDIPRLTGSGVPVEWSYDGSVCRLYIDNSIKAVSNTPVTTYTLNPATTLYLGFPSSTYNESALLVGLTIRDWKMWLYSSFFVHLPDIFDEEVQAVGGSDVGNNSDDQSLKGQACDREIPFSYTGGFVTYSSYSSVSSYNGSEWCPDTSKDNAPYIEFRFEPEGQTAVSKIITTTKDKYNTAGYAATYNIFLSYPPNVKLNGTLLGRKNVSAVRVGESGNITTYYLVFNASVPFETVRIEPVSSVDATGGKCMSIYFQGCNTSELCTTACQNGGTCVGQNLCECREGFFGTNCSLTTDDVRKSPIGSRLRLVNVSSTNFVFNKAKFTSSVSTGVSVNLSRIDLNGFGAYLWAKKADLDKPFDCLTNIDLYSAFTMLFRFRVNSFNMDRPSVILATNAFSKTKGVNIFIQNDNGVNSLNVTFRRYNRQWTAIASTEALQTTGQWVDANIRWENSFGLELVLNGKDIGRALVSTSSNNEEAAYLCLGYPSFGYESYDNNISIRDLTIIPTVSSQIRPSIEAGASTLRIEVANGTVSSQQLGFSLRVFSLSGFSSTGTEIRLKGSNVYLTTNNPGQFFDLLLDPSKYQTFTASYIFSVDNVNVVNYIIDTGNYTGVTMYLSTNLELVVELKWVLMQYRVTYRFSELDIPRLTGSGVPVEWSYDGSFFRLYIDNSLKAVSNSPVTTYTLNPATTLYLGFPSSTYNESALLVGLTIRDWKMWLYSSFFVHLPDIFDEEVQAVGGSDVGNNSDDQSLKGQACDREIPFSYTGGFVTYSSYSSVSSYNGSEWCPDTSKDNAPYIEFRFEPEGQTAVSKIITTTKDKYNTAGYAATYNIFLSYPPNVKLNGTLLGRKNVSAVRVGESGNITTYYLVFNASVPFETVRIEPISSVDATGGKCMSIYFQGCNTSELCTTACQNGGTCVGQNLCECREGFFGTNCSLTSDDVRQSPIGSRLRLVNVSSTNFVFNKAKFTSSVSTGVSVNLSRIDLNGFGAYLWAKKADLDKPFDCLTNIDLYSAFTMLFRFRVNSFNMDRPSVILATNAFSKTKGVNIFIQNDNGVNSLNVTFRRLNRQWTAIASTEALQTTGQWVDANIRWENSFGLELVLNGKDIGRALVSTSSNNEEAAYLCLGYPSFGYESYDNNINIRDLTIIPTVSSQIRPSIEAGASTLRIEVANGTVSSQQLGSSLRVFSSSGFSSTGTEIRLKGFNVFLTTNNPAHFFDLLLDPSKYQTFTASCIFSVDNVNVVNYIIDTGNHTGVTMYLSANLELVVELKWVFMQYRVTYRFSQIDIPRLTGSGVKIGWSFVDRGFRLYIDDSLKAVSNSPVTTYTLSLATTLYLGFPSSTYNESALLVGLTIRDWKMWLYSPFFVHLPDILDEEVQAPEDRPDEEVVTDDLGSSVDARSCSGVITRRQDQVFHLLFSALQADTPERTPVCRNLSIYLARTQEILTSCWRAAEAGNDSISEASFLHYSQRSLAEAFSTILTVICDGSLPRESSEKCDLTGIKAVLTSFFSASLRIGQGEQECSLLWTERERLAALTSSCGATTKAVLGELSSQTVSMVEIACSHPTCSIDYAQLCVSAAEEALTSVTGPRASGDVCMDVKFSLACITNHTVDCSGVQYLRLSEQTRSLYARYRDVCGVNDSSEQDHQRLSVQHGQWLIQAAAVNRLLPNSLFCSLRYRQEWTGQGAQLSLSPLAYPYFENICNDISATSRCNLTACAATPCGSLSRNCLAQNSSSCAGLNGFESLLSLQKDQDRKCGNASSASLLVSTGRPALDAVLLSFRRADYQGIKDLCQWLPRLRNSLATIQGDDVILEQAISFSSALAQSIENTVCSITAPPDNETNCPAALNSIVMAIEAFDLVVKSPFLAQSRREELCRLSLVSRSSSGCSTSADDYAWSVLSAAEDIIDQVCQRMPPLPTCDVNKARDSLQELVSAFLLPTDSACAAIDRVEVAVRRATIDCPPLLAWPITSVMGKLRELAESTCYRGQCDPAGAVICLIDVHHMAKLPVPDWEGVCSILNQSAVCAKQRVSGCDKCQRDTVDTLVAKVNRQLEDTCRAPPVSPCKAVQAYKCKDVLASFRVSGTASSFNDGLLCMRIFEARKCVQKLTVECDDTTKLAVSIDLEAVVKVVNGVKCEEKAVIPKCRAVLAERVKSILSYDPLDPEDPSYDQVIAGNNTEDQQPETGEEPFVPTYLGRLCQDAHLAFQCVQEGLQEFPIGPSEGFFEILNASWTLALTRCRATTKPLKCYTCKEGKSNEGCNGEEQELCPPDRQMCYTRVVRTPEYQNITISKGCIAPLDCRPGSDGTSQTFCCEGAECNQPDNGPFPATCSLSRVSACLDALSGAVLESNSINCSLVVQQTACFEYVQKECKSNGVTEVSQTLSALLNSSTVQECFVQMSDSRCGLYAATALSSLLATASDDIQDSTLCPMLVAVDRELRLATHSGKCDMEEIIAINSSYALLKSQLWDRKCEGVTESTGACQPLAALDYLIQNIDFALPDCGMEAAWEPFNNLTAGCQPVHLQLIKLYVSTLPAQCNASSVPSLPVDPLFPDACLTDIFPMALANNFSAEDMDRIIPCLIQNWPVDFYMNLPPSYRVYSEQSITFIFDFFDGIRNLFDGILISSNVSERCKSSQEEVARLQAVEVLQMIFLPFAPVSESNAFCKVTKSIEDKISLLLTQKCQDDEVQLQSKLLTYLQTYRLSFCPDEEPAPTCLKSSAQECIVRFTTFMVTAKIDTDEVCRAVNRTLQCVRSYTALCSSEEIKNVSRDMMNIAELYYTCTGVKEFVCENSIIQSFNTSSSITSLDGCGTATGTYSCSFARQAVRCYKDTITAIPAVLQNAVSHFNTKYPLLQEFGKDFCRLDLEFWTIGDQCIKPTCNIDIDSCLTVENSTGETVDTSRPRQCLNERLAGCDVVSRSEAVYKIWHDIEIFTMQYGLNITWSSWSRDSDIMSTMLIMKYISKLEISLRNPKWNLLDICWYFDDLKGIQDALADLDSFLLKSVLERPIRALERSLASGCKDQDILGVILDLPAKEDERCPQELQAELIFALVRSVFAGFQPMDAREQLCETLERLSSVNVTACSLGFQKQVELLKIFIGNLGENMCSPPFYCSLEKAQQCVSEMVAVVQGIGTSSSKNTVCSSLNTFDQCVAHVSFQCDNIIATKIESSVASVRELAVSICSEEDPTPSPDTCKAEIEDGCKQVDARKCSRKQMLALMSPLIDNRRHCRALAYTEDCYNRMSKACNKGNSQFDGFSVRFPPAVIQGLQEQRKCKDPQIYTPALVDCTVNCNVSQATICITTLELELRNFDPLGADDACSFIRVARQCLDSQTSNCSDDISKPLYSRLDSVLEYFSDISSSCKDFSSCLSDLTTLSAKILAAGGNLAANASQVLDNVGEVSLDLLCAQASTVWQCVSTKLSLLSSDQYRLVQPIIDPLRKLHDDQCDATVKLRCYHCNGAVLDGTNNKNDKCSNDRACGQKQTRCYEYFEEKESKDGATDILVYRGCMEPQECQERKGQNGFYCCSSEHCNDGEYEDKDPVPELDSCYDRDAVKCAFNYIWALIRQNTVPCRSALANLQCVATYTQACDKDKGLHEAATQLMLTLAQSTCISGPLSPECHPLALLSMNAILTNAYSADSACIAWQQANQSLTVLEAHETCTALDLVAIRESLSFASVITYTFCHPGDCIMSNSSVSAEAGNGGQDGEGTNAGSGGKPATVASVDCDYYGASKCGRDALYRLEGIDSSNSEQICNDVKANATCAVKILENCELESPCLKKLLLQVQEVTKEKCGENFVNPPAESDNSNHTSKSQNATCKPRIMCNLERAMECIEEFSTKVNDTTELCRKLQLAVQCRKENVASCRSLQSMLTEPYFKDYRAVLQQCPDVNLNPNPPQDVYSSASVCVQTILQDIYDGIGANYEPEDVFCGATASLGLCDFTVPDLNNNSTLGKFRDHFSLISKDLCTFSDPSKEPGSREKRENGSSNWDLAFALVTVLRSNFFSVIPLEQRPDICKRVNKGLKLLDSYIENITQIALTRSSQIFLQRIQSEGWNQFFTYCSELDWEQSGCRPDYFQTCMKPFWKISALALTENGTLCRRASNALQCIAKFSNGCDMSVTRVVETARLHVQGVVGNICPNLTLGLFCPSKYSLINNFTCSYSSAQTCLSSVNTNAIDRRFDSYCSNLDKSLSCAKNGLEGCLQSQVDTAAVTLSSKKNLNTELSYCKSSTGLANYSSVCIAREPCSVIGAVEHFENAEVSDCRSLASIRTSFESSLQNCNNTQAMIFASSLFLGFFMRFRQQCPSQFQNLPIITSELSEAKITLVKNLFDALVTSRSKSAVCKAFYDYLESVSNITGRIGSPVAALEDEHGYLRQVLDDFCPGDKTGDSLPQPDGCQLYTAALFVVEELIWPLSSSGMPTADNQEACRRWKEQYVRIAVNKYMARCDRSINDLFGDIIDLSSRHVAASEMCETTSTCIVAEAFYFINQFSVAVTTYSIDNNTVTLCLKKSEAESHVGAFTATCKDSERAIVSASLAQVMGLVTGVCDQVVLPPQPLCPDIPFTQQTCHVVKALVCLVESNLKLLSLDTFIYSDWCTATQQAMSCIAYNTSGCDSNVEDMKAVSSSLDNLRKQAENRCPWLTPDLCGVSPPCPAEFAGCDIYLQLDLLNNPLDDPCSILETAYKCRNDSTRTCTRAQRAVADDSIKRSLKLFPSFTCNANAMDPTSCFLQARAATWQLLTHPNGTANNCQILVNVAECFSSRNVTLPSASLQAALFLDGAIRKSFSKCQGTDPHCGRLTALIINTVYEYISDMATASTFDHVSYCSKRNAILEDTAVIRQLYNQTCSDVSVLDDLEDALRNGPEGSLCDVDTKTECAEIIQNAHKCLAKFNDIDNCSAATELAVCMAPLGLCSENKQLISQYEEKVSQMDVCARLPLVLLRASPNREIYLSEQGGSASISFQVVENYTSYLSSDTNSLRMRLRTEIVNIDPLRCMTSDEAEIPQVVVKGTSNCGIVITAADWINQSVGSIELMAVLDGREDGVRRAKLTLYAEVEEIDPRTSSWNSFTESIKLAQYTVAVDNKDSETAVCSSVGYNFFQTFDGSGYSCFETGTFMMYRNKIHHTFVSITVKKSTITAVYTCAVKVGNANVSIEFNRCLSGATRSRPQDISVTMTKSGDYDQISVYRTPDFGYVIVFSTGTIVQIKQTSSFGLTVYIVASTLDFGKTEGLCGGYDKNAYNDFVQPNGQRYTTQANDMQYGVLSPSGFITAWSIDPNEVPQTASGFVSDLAPTCSCLASNTDASQCSHITRVATCDYVQGVDITSALAAASEQSKSAPGGRRRRAVEDTSTAESPVIVPGWPTPSNWTQAMAKERCEKVLLEASNLRYCDKAVLAANGSYSYADIFTVCMEEIRVSDTAANLTSITKHAEYVCFMMFIRNITYFGLNSVRDTVLEFLDTTCIPADCSGNGQCRQGVCECKPGYVGGDCAYQRSKLPVPTNQSLVYGNLCYITDSNRCEDIFISASQLVESPFLACHIKKVEVDHSGAYQSIGPVSVTKAQLMTASVVQCSWPRTSAQETVAVAISNDGQNPTSAMLISAYDPRCYTCSSSTNYCQKWAQNACQIQGRCYLNGEGSSSDNCLYCNPARSATEWTYKDTPDCEVRWNEAKEKDLLSTVHILIIIACITAFAVIVTTVVGIVCKRRLRRKASQQSDLPPPYLGLSDDSSSLSETSFAPQKAFNTGKPHTRAVTQATPSIPHQD